MTAAKKLDSRKIDSKGRLLIGEEWAGSTVIIEKRSNGEYVIKPAVIIPADEKWLFENKLALDSVNAGLQQAREGKITKSPSFKKNKSWKKELED